LYQDVALDFFLHILEALSDGYLDENCLKKTIKNTYLEGGFQQTFG